MLWTSDYIQIVCCSFNVFPTHSHTVFCWFYSTYKKHFADVSSKNPSYKFCIQFYWCDSFSSQADRLVHWPDAFISVIWQPVICNHIIWRMVKHSSVLCHSPWSDIGVISVSSNAAHQYYVCKILQVQHKIRTVVSRWAVGHCCRLS